MIAQVFKDVRRDSIQPILLDHARRDQHFSACRIVRNPLSFPLGKSLTSYSSAGYVSKRLARALPAGWTGHTLRYRCGTAMYAGTRDLLAVGAVLGHARPETTRRYVRLPDDALISAVKAAA